jgi:hypothetical protein
MQRIILSLLCLVAATDSVQAQAAEAHDDVSTDAHVDATPPAAGEVPVAPAELLDVRSGTPPGPTVSGTAEEAAKYAEQSLTSGLDCWQSIEKHPSKDNKEVRDSIVAYYRSKHVSPVCTAPLRLTRASLDISIWKKRSWLHSDQYQAIQIVPAVVIGLPLAKWRFELLDEALTGSTAFVGVSVRYTPSSYWYTLNLNLGQVAGGNKLDSMTFSDPVVVGFGIGSTVFNAITFDLMHVGLRSRGPFSDTIDGGWYLAASIDITSALLIAPALAK